MMGFLLGLHFSKRPMVLSRVGSLKEFVLSILFKPSLFGMMCSIVLFFLWETQSSSLKILALRLIQNLPQSYICFSD